MIVYYKNIDTEQNICADCAEGTDYGLGRFQQHVNWDNPELTCDVTGVVIPMAGIEKKVWSLTFKGEVVSKHDSFLEAQKASELHPLWPTHELIVKGDV